MNRRRVGAAVVAATVGTSAVASAQLWGAFDRVLLPVETGETSPFVDVAFGAVLVAGRFVAGDRVSLAVSGPGPGFGDYRGQVRTYEFGADFEAHEGPVLLGPHASVEQFATALAAGDFDGDGVDELAVGRPHGDWGGNPGGSGRVDIFDWSFDNLTLETVLTQEPSTGVAESGDRYGAALATGDFNCDGIDDLAVGAPGEDFVGEATTNAGAVSVHYGETGVGLSSGAAHRLHQDAPGTTGVPESMDFFGESLAVGDFDGDGCDDLAVGVPGEKILLSPAAGAVHLFWGDSDGIWTVDDEYLVASDLGGEIEANGRFGSTLAAGNLRFDLCSCDEVVIGAPDEDVFSEADAGAVYLYRPAPAFAIRWTQTSLGGLALAGEQFGRGLAIGDFDGRRGSDLAIGVPGHGGPGFAFTGQVQLIYKGGGGNLDLSTAATISPLDEDAGWRLEPPYVSSQAGFALAAGDFFADGSDDLAIGLPGYQRNVAGDLRTGAAVLLPSMLFGADFEVGDAGEWSP